MIFTRTYLLTLFVFLTFAAMFYLVICFLCYMVSSDQHFVEIAESSESANPDRPRPFIEKGEPTSGSIPSNVLQKEEEEPAPDLSYIVEAEEK